MENRHKFGSLHEEDSLDAKSYTDYEKSNRDTQERYFKQTFCIDNYYENLVGNYYTSTTKSQILQIQMKRCDKRDPIFEKVESCATDEEFEKVFSNNIFMYYADNIIDYTEYSNYKFPYFKKNKALFYEHFHFEDM